MKRYIALIVTGMLLFAGVAFAGVFGTAKGWITGEVTSLIVSAVVAIIAGVGGTLWILTVRVFKEAGTFLTTLADALEDNKVTKDEIASIIREGVEVFTVFSSFKALKKGDVPTPFKAVGK